jgi:esterase/lipase
MMIAFRFPVAGFVAMATPIRIPPTPMYKRLKPILRPLSIFYPFQPKGPSFWYDTSAQAERVAYEYRPLRSVLELELFLADVKTHLPRIQVPGMLIHSLTDEFVPHSDMLEIYNLLGSSDKEMITIETSNHIITCDISREEVFSRVTDFVKRKAGSQG